MPRNRISIIVPVFRDNAALQALLTRITPMGPDEVLIVSPDHPCELTDRRHRWIQVERANRGAQLDAGAREAAGDILWFLHADATPASGALDDIRAAIGGGAESGCFRFRFGGRREWWKRIIEQGIAMRVALGGIAYGDQGLFALRAAYVETGGFAPEPLFEEVPLVRSLRARGTFECLEAEITVAARRWERDGWFRRTIHNRWLACCYMLGVSAGSLANRYRKGTGKQGESRA